MKLKKYSLIITGAMALVMSLNINAMSPAFYVRAENSLVESPRTSECTKHEWRYVSIEAGDDIFFNYECRLCTKLKYDEWLKR